MPSRISGACIACRSKKQKCSGDRFGCTQCQAAGQECTWPEQRKRGPAKGYIEGLEHRLHEAEQLLLQVLPILSTDQLAAVTTGAIPRVNDLGQESPNHRGPSATPPLLNKKVGIEYWEHFPLDSPENIRRWQQDCIEHKHPRASSTHSDQARAAANEATYGRESMHSPTHLQHPSMQTESSESVLRLSGLPQDLPWSDMYQQRSGVAPAAYPPGMTGIDTNSAQCTPWEQHDFSRSSQPYPPRTSGVQFEYSYKAGPAQQTISQFFPEESQRQLFW